MYEVPRQAPWRLEACLLSRFPVDARSINDSGVTHMPYRFREIPIIFVNGFLRDRKDLRRLRIRIFFHDGDEPGFVAE
jgi:hypothetical protein